MCYMLQTSGFNYTPSTIHRVFENDVGLMQHLSIDQRLRWYGLPLLVVSITVLMAALVLFRINGVREHNLKVATEGARNIFRMIVLTREWNAMHGGIYTFVTPQTQPNPYLDHPQRDLVLKDNRQLTMLNPAYMTREIAELAARNDQLHLRLHITSLKPIRPDNQADPWETAALQRLEQGENEIASVESETSTQFLRYMAPLKVSANCLACHSKQGYKLGDLRGGISVSLPYAPINAVINAEIQATLISHALSYALLLGVSAGLLELLARRWRSLNDNIQTLAATRNELVENEKMASLGRLVAGFAHELNTPVGIAVGAVSHGDDTLTRLSNLLKQDEVTEEELAPLISNLHETQHLALNIFRRAADLVQRFKRTSIDRSSQQKRAYFLHELLQDVIVSLQNVLKRTSIDLKIDCPKDLKLYGTPGLVEQIITNLITNSIQHGFDQGKNPGEIKITVSRTANQHIRIDYQDNGLGMSEQVKQQAFEPFFTTQRAQGGSGLGLYVLYNIVTQQLLGKIHLTTSPGNGSRFCIDYPAETFPSAAD